MAWLLAGAAVAVGLVLVFSSVVEPLLSGHGVQPDQAIFAIGALLAAGTLTYYVRYRTKAAKWATYFMVGFCIWAHGLAFVVMELFRGSAIELGDYLRLAAGVLVLSAFGALWVKAGRAAPAKVPK
ncbi:hypothetical protein [Rhodoferax saidenbachensis]|nr:hypothetical protein [Rhodoferax saidenbachensis]